jgi:hypothetical protein
MIDRVALRLAEVGTMTGERLEAILLEGCRKPAKALQKNAETYL